MTHEFKPDTWIEYDDVVTTYGHINTLHPRDSPPFFTWLTLRPGDYCKTEGMTEEDHKILLGHNLLGHIGKQSFGSMMIYDYLVFTGSVFGGISKSVFTGEKRELTIEQILSTLPEEEEKTLQSVLGDAIKKSQEQKAAVTKLLNEPKAQEIDWSKPIQTRDGEKARLLADNLKGENSYSVAIDWGDIEEAKAYHSNGRLWKSGVITGLDLINIPEEHKLEVYVYHQNGEVRCEEAREFGATTPSGIVAKLNITYIHGQGLDDE